MQPSSSALLCNPATDDVSEDTHLIARLVRQKLAIGSLPRYGTAQLWGGSGKGLLCDVCERPVAPNQAEIAADIGVDEEQTTLRLHPHCYSIWQAERLK